MYYKYITHKYITYKYIEKKKLIVRPTMIFVITTQKVVLDCYENFFKNKNFANTGFVNLLIDNSLVTGVTNLTA